MTHNSKRGEGVGAGMVRAGIEWLRARGATTIEDDIARVAEESAGDPLAAFL